MKRTVSALDDLPREMFLEILFRLQIKPLFRFKCVSKQWNSVISDPKFRQIYLQRSPSPLSAILYPYVDCREDLRPQIQANSPHSLYVTTFYRPQGGYHIEDSSNGLILSYLTPQQYPCNEDDYVDEYEFEWEHLICVSNPLTNQSVKLPPLWLTEDQYDHYTCGLATRASRECVSYKVVFIQVMKNHPYRPDFAGFAQIDIFCSDTGKWTCKERVSCPGAVLNCDTARAVSYKGILHCFDWKTMTLVTYDPYDSPDGFGFILLPAGLGKKSVNSGVNLIRLGCNEEFLEFGEIEDCGDSGWRLCVWRLVDYEKREWCVEKRCLISPLWEGSLLRDCRLLVAPDPWNDEFFGLLCANENKVTVLDLANTEKVFSFEAKERTASFASRLAGLMVPIALNPWSSPFHGEAGRNASSKPGYRKIIPAWFPSYSKNCIEIPIFSRIQKDHLQFVAAICKAESSGEPIL